MAKLKPLTKGIVIAIVLGAGAYAASEFVDYRKAHQPAQPEVQVQPAQVPSPAPIPHPVELVRPAPEVPAPQPAASNDSASNSGLNALMQSGRK